MNAVKKRVVSRPAPTRPESFKPNELYSPKEVAERLKLRQARQVRDWVRHGRIDSEGVIVMPRDVRIYGWALNEFLEKRRRAA